MLHERLQVARSVWETIVSGFGFGSRVTAGRAELRGSRQAKRRAPTQLKNEKKRRVPTQLSIATLGSRIAPSLTRAKDIKTDALSDLRGIEGAILGCHV